MKQNEVFKLVESAPIRTLGAKLVLMSLCGNSGGGFDWNSWSRPISASYIHKRFNRFAGSEGNDLHNQSISIRTINRSLKELSRDGLITMSDSRGRGDLLITLNLDRLIEMSTPQSSPDKMSDPPMSKCPTPKMDPPMSKCPTSYDKMADPPMTECPTPMSKCPTTYDKMAYNEVFLSSSKSNTESLLKENAPEPELTVFEQLRLKRESNNKNIGYERRAQQATKLKARTYSS